MDNIFPRCIKVLFLLFVVTLSYGQWRPITGLFGGTILSTNIAEGKSDTAIIAGTSFGLFTSTNMGLNWIQINDSFTFSSIKSIIVCPIDSGNNYIFATIDHGIIRSLDNGRSWNLIDTNLVLSLAATTHELGSFDLYSSNEHGISLSTDRGMTWNQILPSNKYVLLQSLSIWHNDIFAGDLLGGVYQYRKDSLGWKQINWWLRDKSIYSLAISEDTLGQPIILAGTASYGIYRSNDTGSTWGQVPSGLESGTTTSIVCDPIQRGTFYACATPYGMARSSNYGISWERVSIANTDPLILSISVHGHNIFAGTNGGGIIRSTDEGNSWSYVNDGLTNIEIPVLGICNQSDGGALILTAPQNYQATSYLSSNDGLSWQPIDSLQATILLFAIIKDSLENNDIFAGAKGIPGRPSLYFSHNKGLNWTRRDSGMTSMSVYSLIQSMNAVESERLFAATGYDGIFTSTDYGLHWNSISSGLSNRFITTLTCLNDSTHTDYLFAGTDAGVYRSTNNGLNWLQTFSGLGNRYISTIITSHVQNRFTLYAGTYQGIFRSTDMGLTWVQKNNGLKDTIVTSLISNGTYVFAGTMNEGIFMSKDDGDYWEDVNGMLPNKHISSLSLSDLDVYVGTQGSGIWKRALGELQLEVKNVHGPFDVELRQNYPNPFNPSTKIQFNLSSRSFVMIDIFNILGQKIKGLISNFLQPGSYSVTWDATGLPSGVYYCQMKANGYNKVIKLILEK